LSSVGEDDSAVREWCKENKVHYQPYASARNVKQLQSASPAAHEVVTKIAKAHSQTTHAVIYKYFLQSGAAIIPRSTDSLHMAENLDNLNWSLTSIEMKELKETTKSKK
jgi:diketogulonate reductase-like aldo/keto reductase